MQRTAADKAAEVCLEDKRSQNRCREQESEQDGDAQVNALSGTREQALGAEARQECQAGYQHQ